MSTTMGAVQPTWKRNKGKPLTKPSCGGGGSSGSGSQSLSSGSGSLNSNTATSGTTNDDPLISAKVIDGYIQGANVYIDFNWNLQQDEGEPSAVDNGDGDYEFPYNDGEFDAITDVSLLVPVTVFKLLKSL